MRWGTNKGKILSPLKNKQRIPLSWDRMFALEMDHYQEASPIFSLFIKWTGRWISKQISLGSDKYPSEIWLGEPNQKDLKTLEIRLTYNEIKELSKNEFKTILNETVEEKAFKSLMDMKQEQKI